MNYLTYLGLAIAVHSLFVGYFTHEFSLLLAEHIDVLANASDTQR